MGRNLDIKTASVMTRDEKREAREEAAFEGYLADFRNGLARGARGFIPRPWQYPREQHVATVVAELISDEDGHELLAQIVYALRDAAQGMPRSAAQVVDRLARRYAMVCMNQHFEMGDHIDAPNDIRDDDERAERAREEGR